jgi:hypothetical protein
LSDSKPLVALENSGQPSILNYNVPEPVSYTGRNLIELKYDKDWFLDLKGREKQKPKKEENPEATRRNLEQFLRTQPMAAQLKLEPATVSGTAREARGAGAARRSAASEITSPGPHPMLDDEALAQLEMNKLPYVVPTQSGGTKVVYADTSNKPFPGICLVEIYRMTNHLGDYGAGRTVQTFSLLPGEKTRISIKSYKSSTETLTETSSIFDSYSTTAEDTFESSVQAENSDKETKEKTTEYYMDAEVGGN